MQERARGNAMANGSDAGASLDGAEEGDSRVAGLGGRAGSGVCAVRSAPEVARPSSPGPPLSPIGSGLQRMTTVAKVRQMAHQYRPDFWNNLPTMSKLFLALTLLNVLLGLTIALLDVAANQQVCSCGDSHNIPLSIIDSCPPALRGACRWEPASLYLSIIACWVVAFYTFFAVVALLQEDAHALAASVVLLVIQTMAVLYFAVDEWKQGPPSFGGAAAVIGSVTVVLQLALMLLAWATHRQMGWRTYSRVAADVREKDALKMRRLYLDVHKFTTALKMDLMVSLLLATVRIVVWLGLPVFSSSRMTTAAFIIWPSVGLGCNLLWAVLCWVTVRHERRTLCKWVTVLMLVSLAYFIAAFVAVNLNFQDAAEKLAYYGVAETARQEIINEPRASLALLGVLTLLLLVIRVQTWFGMRRIITRYAASPASMRRRELAPLQAIRSLSVLEPSRELELDRIHPSLAALVRGAWIGKPSSSNTRKSRFFQLSGDGTTLRWAWNKYILMLYVEDVLEGDDLTLTLVITTEPDLVLKFMDEPTYQTWRKGLRTLLALLLGPEGMDARPSGLNKLADMLCDHGRHRDDASATPSSTAALSRASSAAPSAILRQVLDSQHQQQLQRSDAGRLSAALGGMVTYSTRASLADPDGIRIQIAKGGGAGGAGETASDMEAMQAALTDCATYCQFLRERCTALEAEADELARRAPPPPPDNGSRGVFGLDATREAIQQAVKETAGLSAGERKKQIRQLQLRWHPDKNPVLRELAGEVSKLINEAAASLEAELAVEERARVDG
eukprot:jgi/Tetstr1/466755/TSEL_011225.t1